ncbi:MAG TPA: hypothetical protein VNO79_02665 [Actinomycetota bacterium]|nr:hypothetical protein [Actinomycetota bacterium]
MWEVVPALESPAGAASCRCPCGCRRPLKPGAWAVIRNGYGGAATVCAACAEEVASLVGAEGIVP